MKPRVSSINCVLDSLLNTKYNFLATQNNIKSNVQNQAWLQSMLKHFDSVLYFVVYISNTANKRI